MFTGIVTDVGRVRAVRDTNRDRRFEVETGFDLSTVDLGASISNAGVCLTVVEKGESWFAVEVSGETLSLTTLSEWAPGRRVNLERAAKVGDELGGHIVSGHVDGLGEVVSVEAEGGSDRVVIRAPRRRPCRPRWPAPGPRPGRRPRRSGCRCRCTGACRPSGP